MGSQPEDDFCDYDQNCEWTTDHYPLPLYANSKILTIYRGNKNYLLPVGIIGSADSTSHVTPGFLYIHIYSSVYDLN
jgi:hypothetical protein